MLVTDGGLQTRKWKRGWNYDRQGLIYVRPPRYLGLQWQDALSSHLDKGQASAPVRRATFVDLIAGMAGEITPEVVYSRLERRLKAQHDGLPRWNQGEPGVKLPPAP